MPVRTHIIAAARGRGRVLRMQLGQDVRHARLAAGLRLVDIGRAVGRSAAWVSRAERGLVRRIALEELVVLGAAVGVKVWTTTFPAERAIRDAPQAALLRRFRSRAGPRWRWNFEVIVPIARDQRAADAVMQFGEVRIMVEAFTRLADSQAQLRAVLLKARDLGIGRVIIVVAATNTNRRALAKVADLLAADFPLGTRAVLAALKAGRDPGSNGVVVV
ncbi:MAG TPA: helix-turn-helix transcriptional regulator [Candidatus Limnocylindria bacterium]